jgi:15-cis-phytoene desaturase
MLSLLSASTAYSTPSGVFKTANYREATDLSERIAQLAGPKSARCAIIGGGLSGLACAKYLADAGHTPTVYEGRKVLGGKVSAWQDDDGDWVETGLHIFFGAYPNMMRLFSELDIHDRLQWKQHRMAFAMRERPGEFTTFDFTPGVPAPFGMALAILRNTQMLTWAEKVQMVPALLPMLLEGQPFIDRQDELSVSEFMDKYGMPARVKDEVFIAMGKALDFIDPEKLSMSVVLTAMNRFINEADGSQTAFLDGNQPERLCAPMVSHVEARGGAVLTGAPVREIVLDDDGDVRHLLLGDGSTVEADYYISAVPCDVFQRLLPEAWRAQPFFAATRALKGIPVINLQLWFDRKLASSLDGLAFSRSPLLSVYADMSRSCAEYADDDASMIELVFAPCTPQAGADRDWLKQSDEAIVDATLGELARLFPREIAGDARTAASPPPGAPAAGLRKYSVVRVPRSVYAAVPGAGKFRPSQTTPIDNFVLAGDWSQQRFLGSMEGAVLAGKLAAEVVASRAAGEPPKEWREPAAMPDADHAAKAQQPVGFSGASPVAFGGGQQGGFSHP